jgi:serine protease inhibitor
MMFSKKIVIPLFVACMIFIETTPAFSKTKIDLKRIAEDNNAFALDLYSKLQEQDGNLCLSPYIISTGLAMTYVGARENTAAQMAKALHFTLTQQDLHPTFTALIEATNSADKKGACQLITANAIWAQKGYKFLNTFMYMLDKNYLAKLHEVNFEEFVEDARTTINAWVEKQTKNKIKDLLKPGILDENTRLVLVNAIYFKGNWIKKFNKKKTKNAPFHSTADLTLTVPMMRQKGDFKYSEDEDMQVIELPYLGNRLSMLIVLPREPDGLPTLEKKLTLENLRKWSDNDFREIEIYLPRFKITAEFSLKDTLAALGMTDAFSGIADFSGMDGKKGLFIQAVLHKALVEVNEEGTQAAAATGIAIQRTVLSTLSFRADHPFLFFIKDNRSDNILFIGRVIKPEN